MGVARIPSKVNSVSPDTWPGKFLTRKLSWSFAPFLTMFMWFLVPAARRGDMMNYFLCFRDMLQIEPEFPLLMLFRRPLTPLRVFPAHLCGGAFGILLA